MASKLDVASNIATIVAAAGLVTTLAVRTWHPTATTQAELRVGGRAPALAGISFNRAKKTLLVVVRHDCKPCSDSMPFYRRLPPPEPVNGNTTLERQFIAVALDDPQIARAYITANGLPVNAVVAFARDKQDRLGIAGTPTLVLVDNTGTIRKIWLGRLDPQREAEVIAALGSAT